MPFSQELPSDGLSRRTVLLGLTLAPAAALVGCSPVVAASSAAPTQVTYPPRWTPTPPQSKAGPTILGTMHSKATGSDHDWRITYPPGTKPGDKLPVAIMLHGHGDAITAIPTLGYPEILAAVVRSGVKPFALAAVYGGNLFWQNHNGQDAGAMVATEFVKLLKRQGLNTSRLALTGWSMGGWGALRLACGELHGKLRAVVALSTPCYASYDELPVGDWMTRAEFEANNFYHRSDQLTDLPIFLACGASDPFLPGNKAFAAVLEQTPGVIAPVLDFGPGEHGHPYWQSMAATQFRFLGKNL